MDKFEAVFGFVILFLVIALLGASVITPFYSCPAKWEASGLSAEFKVLSGCMVKRKDGTIVPEKAIRDISL